MQAPLSWGQPDFQNLPLLCFNNLQLLQKIWNKYFWWLYGNSGSLILNFLLPALHLEITKSEGKEKKGKTGYQQELLFLRVGFARRRLFFSLFTFYKYIFWTQCSSLSWILVHMKTFCVGSNVGYFQRVTQGNIFRRRLDPADGKQKQTKRQARKEIWREGSNERSTGALLLLHCVRVLTPSTVGFNCPLKKHFCGETHREQRLCQGQPN